MKSWVYDPPIFYFLVWPQKYSNSEETGQHLTPFSPDNLKETPLQSEKQILGQN